MKFLNAIFISLCLLILGMVAIMLSPLKEPVLNELQMEANAQLNELITSPNSSRLAPLTLVKGQQPEIDAESTTNIDNTEIDEWMSKSQTEVLLIQQRGKIIYESYSKESQRGLQINGMSLVKNIVALLIGVAIDEGHIASQQSDIKQYLPELTINSDRKVSIRDLLNHRSGLVSDTTDLEKTLAGASLIQQLPTMQFRDNPSFNYNNINYHLLSLIMSRAYDKPLSQLIEEKLWLPLHLEQAGIVENNGYCCLFATARSWLALGQLYLDNGNYNGQQLVPQQWIKTMLSDSERPAWFFMQNTGVSQGNSYGYHIYGGLKDYPDYYWIEGMGLQLIMINPITETVIVRLGGIPSIIRYNSNRWDKFLLEDLMSTALEERL